MKRWERGRLYCQIVRKWTRNSCKRQVTSGSPDMPLTLRTMPAGFGVTAPPSFHTSLSLDCNLAFCAAASSSFQLPLCRCGFHSDFARYLGPAWRMKHACAYSKPFCCQHAPVCPTCLWSIYSFLLLISLVGSLFLMHCGQKEKESTHSSLCLSLNDIPQHPIIWEGKKSCDFIGGNFIPSGNLPANCSSSLLKFYRTRRLPCCQPIAFAVRGSDSADIKDSWPPLDLHKSHSHFVTSTTFTSLQTLELVQCVRDPFWSNLKSFGHSFWVLSIFLCILEAGATHWQGPSHCLPHLSHLGDVWKVP